MIGSAGRFEDGYMQDGFNLSGMGLVNMNNYSGHDPFGYNSRGSVTMNPGGPQLISQAVQQFLPNSGPLAAIGGQLADQALVSQFPQLNGGTQLQAFAQASEQMRQSNLVDAFGGVLAQTTPLGAEASKTVAAGMNMFGMLDSGTMGSAISRLGLDSAENTELAGGLKYSSSQRAMFLQDAMGAFLPGDEELGIPSSAQRAKKWDDSFERTLGLTDSSVFASGLNMASARYGLDLEGVDDSGIQRLKQTSEQMGKSSEELLDSLSKLTDGAVNSLGPRMEEVLKGMQEGVLAFGKTYDYMVVAAQDANKTLKKMGINSPEMAVEMAVSREYSQMQGERYGTSVNGFVAGVSADRVQAEFVGSDVGKVLSYATDLGATGSKAYNRLTSMNYDPSEESGLLSQVMQDIDTAAGKQGISVSDRNYGMKNGGSAASRAEVLKGLQGNDSRVNQAAAMLRNGPNQNAYQEFRDAADNGATPQELLELVDRMTDGDKDNGNWAGNFGAERIQAVQGMLLGYQTDAEVARRARVGKYADLKTTNDPANITKMQNLLLGGQEEEVTKFLDETRGDIGVRKYLAKNHIVDGDSKSQYEALSRSIGWGPEVRHGTIRDNVEEFMEKGKESEGATGSGIDIRAELDRFQTLIETLTEAVGKVETAKTLST